MSKMPAKKKSCFQITSVTQAQVAANSATDDTESLDDPDESRTEDVSSEIFDMSRTDYEPEVCDRSSSEETLNNVGEPEGQLPAVSPLNGGYGVRNALSAGQQSAGGVQASCAQHAVTSQPAQVTNSSSSSTIASCTSRFRVIKLDHGSGEPFRRGRWTCTEYYEKDPEGSAMSRTVDSIRHSNVTEPGADRDSGLGATVATEASYDGSPFTITSPLYPLEPQQPQSFSIIPQQIAVSGSLESFSNKSVPVSVPQQVQGNSHVGVPQSLQPPVHDGSHIHKSPGMPPPLLYQPQQQLPISHHLQTQPGLISAVQPDYGQQLMSITHTQTHPGASLSVGHAVNQGPSPVQTPATVGMQILSVETSGVPGGVPLVSNSISSMSSLVQPPVGLLTSITTMPLGTSIQQQPVGQYQAPGVIHGLPTAPQSTQNMSTVPVTISGMPATNVPTAVPGSASAGAALSNLNTSVHNQPSPVPRNGTAVGMSTPAMPSSSFNLADESRGISDTSVPAVQNKDMMMPSITESLQLPNPAVNSLFGISISIDGDDDRNPSKAFFQAFQSGSRLKDSKMACDSASGGSMVAIDNKIEQAMDLVKSHLMYAVREEVEVLKEQIKELYERNSVLERENAVLKSLANNDQLSQLSVQASSNPPNTPSQLGSTPAQPPLSQPQPYLQLDVNNIMEPLPQQPQPNVTSA